jgi:hypothetical protein
MRLRKNGNARDPARPRELVKVDIDEHGARGRDALAQRGIDKLTVVKVPSFHELDEQVATETIMCPEDCRCPVGATPQNR